MIPRARCVVAGRRHFRGVLACLDAQAYAGQEPSAEGRQAIADAFVRSVRFVKGGVSMATLPTDPYPEVGQLSTTARHHTIPPSLDHRGSSGATVADLGPATSRPLPPTSHPRSRHMASPSHDLAFPPRQVAFVGRSNVGKSSLTNFFVGRRAIAYTSKTPGTPPQPAHPNGRTQALVHRTTSTCTAT